MESRNTVPWRTLLSLIAFVFVVSVACAYLLAGIGPAAATGIAAVFIGLGLVLTIRGPHLRQLVWSDSDAQKYYGFALAAAIGSGLTIVVLLWALSERAIVVPLIVTLFVFAGTGIVSLAILRQKARLKANGRSSHANDP